MATYKNLSKDQLEALQVMASFSCGIGNISCDDCPLYSDEHKCGSIMAMDILEQYEKENK